MQPESSSHPVFSIFPLWYTWLAAPRQLQNLILPLKQKCSGPLLPHAQGTDQFGLAYRAHRLQHCSPCLSEQHGSACEPEPWAP